MENKRIGNSGEWVWLDGLVVKRGNKVDMVTNAGVNVARLERRGDLWGIWGMEGESRNESVALRKYAEECYHVMVMPVDD